MDLDSNRYSAVAIALHWLIAFAVLANVALGVWMHEAIDVPASQTLAVEGYQLHKSLGFMVLLFTFLRIGWLLAHKPPQFPTSMSARQQLLAGITHKALYFLLLLIPVSGWLLVSTQWRGDTALNVETVLFDRIAIGNLFALDQQSAQVRQQMSGILVNVHWVLGLSMGLLVVLHVGAALKHQFIDRDRLLRRMLFNLGGPRHWPAAVATLLLLGLLSFYAFVAMQPTVGQSLATTARITSAPESWQVVPESSSIRFSGEHAGTSFTGEFSSWSIDARLNAQDLTQSESGVVTIDMASAVTGKPLYDRTLPEAEWFDIANYPTARFEMNTITPKPEGGYRMQGMLLIKDRRIPIDELLLRRITDGVQVTGGVSVGRVEANLGLASDQDGAWVSTDIMVSVDAILKPPGR